MRKDIQNITLQNSKKEIPNSNNLELETLNLEPTFHTAENIELKPI
jgi:hypothetical protein